MISKKPKIAFDILIISALLISGLVDLTNGRIVGDELRCDKCDMVMDSIGQARFNITDSSGVRYVACCPGCALMLQRTLGDLNITSFCDYYGPSYPINIITRNNGTDVTVSPLSAVFIAGGNCMKNRLVYDSLAADALLAPPNNGTSQWLSPKTNATVLTNATRMSAAIAALFYGIGLPSPTPTSSPTPSPSPSPSPSPTSSLTPSSSPSISPTVSPTPLPSRLPEPTTTALVTQMCEVCGMDVTPDSQTRYIATDGTVKVHYVECFMCAMQLINDYDTLKIETYCDWYGPNYPITINTSNFGKTVSVSPSTAIYLRGGSCITARAAYNQTAADNLLANGFSQYTSTEQHYALPSTTQVKLVNDAISTWYAQADTTAAPTSLTLTLGLVIGIVIIGGTIIAYKRMKR